MKQLILYFVSWRLLLSLVVILGVNSLPYQPTFLGPETLTVYGQRWLTTWANFDGVHYLIIAQKGYVGWGLIQAFFPLYPLVIRLVSGNLINPLMVGIMISTVCAFVGLIYLIKLIRLDETNSTADKTVGLILCFPTAFYLTALYNEGLFLLLIVMSFWWARQKKWWLAGVIGALAAATRLVGVLIIPALFIEYFMYLKSHPTFKNNIPGMLFWCLLPVTGLLGYMIYLGYIFHDPLLFYHVQTAFGAGREAGTVVFLPQIFFRYLKIFLTLQPDGLLWYRTVLEFAAGLGGLGLVILAFWKTRLSYAVFCALAFILPTLTGNFSSLPRYLLPLFPLLMVLSKITSRWAYLAIAVVFVILQVINLLLFTQGLFIS